MQDAASIRKQMSVAQGGKGVALRNQRTLNHVGPPISIGQSPGPGTFATVYLTTNHDTAYDNAVLIFEVEQFGRLAIFDVQTISPSDNANYSQLIYTAGTCASDAWSVYIALGNAVLPAAPLQSAIVASGVENIPSGGGGGTYTGDFPIVVTGTVISIDPSVIPWVKVGGAGGVIEAVDTTAAVIAGGATSPGGGGVQSFAFGPASVASSPGAAAFGGGTATNANDFAAFGEASGGGSAAFNGGIATGNGSFAGAGGQAQSVFDTAFGSTSVASGTNSFAAAGGVASSPGSAAFTEGSATGDGGFAVGFGSQVNANDAIAFLGGIANQAGSMALGPITAGFAGAVAIGTTGGPALELGNFGGAEIALSSGAGDNIYFANGTTLIGIVGIDAAAAGAPAALWLGPGTTPTTELWTLASDSSRAQLRHPSQVDIEVGTLPVIQCNTSEIFFIPDGTLLAQYNGGTGEASFGYNVSTGSFSGGNYNGGVGGCLFLNDVGTAPSAGVPVGGGILFVDAGTLKYVGGAGVIQTVAL